jgi:hypothetical protein
MPHTTASPNLPAPAIVMATSEPTRRRAARATLGKRVSKLLPSGGPGPPASEAAARN